MAPDTQGEAKYGRFLQRGWAPNWHLHPPNSPLEMVLVEPRDHPNLTTVLCNASCVLPYASLTVVHSRSNARRLHDLVSGGNVRLLEQLPADMSRDAYSELMCSPGFWEQMRGERVLILQTDAGIRHNNVLRYMQYDFVGAPWPWQVMRDPRICVGNGGFSLRRTALMHDIASSFKFSVEAYEAEDLFFAKHLVDVDTAVLPTRDVAGTFSMEYMDYGDPMGFHQAYKIQPPEVVDRLFDDTLLCSGRATSDTNLLDAWVEAANGATLRCHRLLPWLRLGIGPDGMFIGSGTRLSCLGTDPAPGHRKTLHISLVKDGERRDTVVPLDRLCVVHDVWA